MAQKRAEELLTERAADYAAQAADKAFEGRYGHGGQNTPIVYRQMFRRELADLLKGAFLAGAADSARST